MIGQKSSSSVKRTNNNNKTSQTKKPSIESTFHHFIRSIKFCLRNISNPEERRIVLNWINKLCECALPSNPESERKNCNLYAQILLKMLQRGHVRNKFFINSSYADMCLINFNDWVMIHNGNVKYHHYGGIETILGNFL